MDDGRDQSSLEVRQSTGELSEWVGWPFSILASLIRPLKSQTCATIQMSNSMILITLAQNVQIWWSKAFWKALGLAHLIEHSLELLGSLLRVKSTSERRSAWNKISVTYGLPNCLRQSAQHPDLQQRYLGGLRDKQKGIVWETSASVVFLCGGEQFSNHSRVALLWRFVTQPFRVWFRRRLLHWKATILPLHFEP